MDLSLIFQIDNGPDEKIPATSNHDEVRKSRLLESEGKVEDIDEDDPMSNRLFYLAGKRSPRIRRDPDWTSLRLVASRPVSTCTCN